MSHQSLLVDGQWRSAEDPIDSFDTVDPATEETLPHTYPVSRFGELEEMLEAGRSAAQTLRTVAPEVRAAFLETFADRIEARSEELVEWAHRETALAASPRLANIELPRTTDQLRQAAQAARARTWCEATIDTEANIRSRFEPLGGAVVVMGPNNFPFAFNAVSGGDFAAAVAAGNPVVAKAHPAHPETSRLLAEEGHKAAQAAGMPPATLQMFYHAKDAAGRTLVAHDLTGATAFTGSQPAGLALKEAANEAGNPIYLEMSSVNPVFLLEGALQERLDDLVDELAASCGLGAGQFCTNPGLVILPSTDTAETFTDRLASAFDQQETGTLFTADGPQQIADAIRVWQEHGAELVTGGTPTDDVGYGFENTLLRVSGDAFLENAVALQTEAFGTTSLLVFADGVEQMTAIARKIEGNLTGGLFTHTEGDDEEAYEQIEPVLRERVGRVLNDKMPTGVAVTPAMVHGGPYPATGHPGFTAVGIPASLRRFAAKRCYDEVRPHRLPPELQDENPTGEMWRFIDRDWTQDDV
jgi:NADP-dependent aldehyde dehydrogenase